MSYEDDEQVGYDPATADSAAADDQLRREREEEVAAQAAQATEPAPPSAAPPAAAEAPSPAEAEPPPAQEAPAAAAMSPSGSDILQRGENLGSAAATGLKENASEAERLFKKVLDFTRSRFGFDQSEPGVAPGAGYDPGATPSEMRMASAVNRGLTEGERQAGTGIMRAAAQSFQTNNADPRPSETDQSAPGAASDAGYVPKSSGGENPYETRPFPVDPNESSKIEERLNRAAAEPPMVTGDPRLAAEVEARLNAQSPQPAEPQTPRAPPGYQGKTAAEYDAAEGKFPNNEPGVGEGRPSPAQVARYLSHVGAMQPEAMQQAEQQHAPNVSDPSEKTLRTLRALSQEDMAQASQYLHGKMADYQGLRATAYGALRQGDVSSAAQIATAMHGNVPDGKTLIFKPTQQGAIQATTMGGAPTQLPAGRGAVSAITIDEDGNAKSYTLNNQEFAAYLRGPEGQYDHVAHHGVDRVMAHLEASGQGAGGQGAQPATQPAQPTAQPAQPFQKPLTSGDIQNLRLSGRDAVEHMNAQQSAGNNYGYDPQSKVGQSVARAEQERRASAAPQQAPPVTQEQLDQNIARARSEGRTPTAEEALGPYQRSSDTTRVRGQDSYVEMATSTKDKKGHVTTGTQQFMRPEFSEANSQELYGAQDRYNGMKEIYNREISHGVAVEDAVRAARASTDPSVPSFGPRGPTSSFQGYNADNLPTAQDVGKARSEAGVSNAPPREFAPAPRQLGTNAKGNPVYEGQAGAGGSRTNPETQKLITQREQDRDKATTSRQEQARREKAYLEGDQRFYRDRNNTIQYKPLSPEEEAAIPHPTQDKAGNPIKYDASGQAWVNRGGKIVRYAGD